METSITDNEYNEQYSKIEVGVSKNLEEHARTSKKLKVMHNESDIISKEVCSKVLFLLIYLLSFILIVTSC